MRRLRMKIPGRSTASAAGPVVWLMAAFLILLSCSIKAPEVRVTGEMTALEREVIGTYREIEQETWMVASTRSNEDGKKVTLSAEKKKVLEAKQRQKFNQDDVEEFKKLGYVGENNMGFLEVMDADVLKQDTAKAKLVDTIVQEENLDRGVIVDRVIELNDNLKNAVRDNILHIFAEMNQKNSPVGSWIQDQLGKWTQKMQ